MNPTHCRSCGHAFTKFPPASESPHICVVCATPTQSVDVESPGQPAASPASISPPSPIDNNLINRSPIIPGGGGVTFADVIDWNKHLAEQLADMCDAGWEVCERKDYGKWTVTAYNGEIDSYHCVEADDLYAAIDSLAAMVLQGWKPTAERNK